MLVLREGSAAASTDVEASPVGLTANRARHRRAPGHPISNGIARHEHDGGRAAQKQRLHVEILLGRTQHAELRGAL
jgi:hypothetical protein